MTSSRRSLLCALAWLAICAAPVGANGAQPMPPPVAPAIAVLTAPAQLALDEPVEKGRAALGSGWQYPWYDPATDGVRRVRVRETWQLPNFNWNPGSFRVDWLQWVMWIVISLLLALMVYVLIRVYLRSEDLRAMGTAGGDDVDGIDDAERIAALPFRVDRRTLDLLEEARRHYQAGRYSQAIVYLFSHELVELDKRQFLRLAKGKTNRQYLREVPSTGPLRGLLEQSMVAFEDAFFGDHALDRARFEACWNRVAEFNRLTLQVPT